MNALLRGSIFSRSQPKLAARGPTVHKALPEQWLREIARFAGRLSIKASGAPEDAAYISTFARVWRSVGRLRQAAKACFAVQRPRRQSVRRLAKRMVRRQIASSGLSH